MNVCKVAAIQMSLEERNSEANCDKAESLIKAIQEEVDIIVLPECLNQGHFYAADRNQYAEKLNGYTTSRMLKMAKDIGVNVAYGINERIEDKYHSAMILVGPDGVLGRYHKRHPAYAEKLYWTEGEEPALIDTSWGKIGLLICYDMSYPESVAAYMGKADLLLVSSAWPTMKFGRNPWEHNTVLPRAIAMQLRVPVVYSNPIGDLIIPVSRLEGGITYYRTSFSGNSAIYDCCGEILCQLDGEEGFARAELNLFYSRSIRRILACDFQQMEKEPLQ